MKIMGIKSGLGNAMFQYATYLQLKKQYPNEKVYLDTIWYEYTGYPDELNRVFHLYNENEVFFKQILSSKINTDELLHDYRYWEKYGFTNWLRFMDACNSHDTSYIHGLSYASRLWNYAEVLEVYHPYIQDLNVVSDMPFTFRELEEIAKKGVSENFNKHPFLQKMERLMKNKNSTLYQTAKAMANPYKRKKLLVDIVHFRKPDYTGYQGIHELLKSGNTYYNLYGNPNHCVGIRKELLKAFQFPEIDDKNRDIQDWITNSDSVAIHARVEDFWYGMRDCIKRNYFLKAVNYIKNKTRKKHVFYVFSDNIEWCRKNTSRLGLEETDQVVFVEGNTGENSYRDMQLMAQCKHIICPQSTFSWWAGYLMRNPDKIFVTPYGTWPGTISF